MPHILRIDMTWQTKMVFDQLTVPWHTFSPNRLLRRSLISRTKGMQKWNIIKSLPNCDWESQSHLALHWCWYSSHIWSRNTVVEISLFSNFAKFQKNLEARLYYYLDARACLISFHLNLCYSIRQLSSPFYNKFY